MHYVSQAGITVYFLSETLAKKEEKKGRRSIVAAVILLPNFRTTERGKGAPQKEREGNGKKGVTSIHLFAEALAILSSHGREVGKGKDARGEREGKDYEGTHVGFVVR